MTIKIDELSTEIEVTEPHTGANEPVQPVEPAATNSEELQLIHEDLCALGEMVAQGTLFVGCILLLLIIKSVYRLIDKAIFQHHFN